MIDCSVRIDWQDNPRIGEFKEKDGTKNRRRAFARGGQVAVRSLVDSGESGWEVPAMFERDGALFVRRFNASGNDDPRDIRLGFEADKIELVELVGRVIQDLKTAAADDGYSTIRVQMPRFGIRTLRFQDLRSPGRKNRCRLKSSGRTFGEQTPRYIGAGSFDSMPFAARSGIALTMTGAFEAERRSVS
ncbi:MAG: hypothetical protein ABI680_00045 [Chthoniobacteraceae bacterium]